MTKGLNTDTKHNTEAGLKLKRKKTKYGQVYEILVLIESVSSEGSGRSAQAHTCLSNQCLHTWKMDVDNGSDHKLDL